MRCITLSRPRPPRTDYEIFDGSVYMQQYFESGSEILDVAEVTFGPDGRTRWHSHDGDQLLIVTGGHGIIANETASFEVRAGDVVLVPAGERHWHGPQPGAEFSHISVLTPGEDHIGESVE